MNSADIRLFRKFDITGGSFYGSVALQSFYQFRFGSEPDKQFGKSRSVDGARMFCFVACSPVPFQSLQRCLSAAKSLKGVFGVCEELSDGSFVVGIGTDTELSTDQMSFLFKIATREFGPVDIMISGGG